jgi:hypothetical protein
MEIEWLHKPRVGGSIPPAATSGNAILIIQNASYLSMSTFARDLYQGLNYRWRSLIFGGASFEPIHRAFRIMRLTGAPLTVGGSAGPQSKVPFTGVPAVTA